jgi:uncharacterized repeat protein (TIGR01451 family)
MNQACTNAGRRSPRTRFALAVVLCALIAGCSSGPFASNRPIGGESFNGCLTTGGLPKCCLPKLCGPKVPALPVAAPPKAIPGVRIVPSRLVAPVNSEVIVLAGLCHEDGYLTTHERIEWTLDNGSVGQFLAPAERHFPHNLAVVEGGAQKLSPVYAIGHSSRREQTLTRGTAASTDDVLVHKGQAWITVTAASEGTSHVTAFAPGAKAWTQHRNTATIHWVDAQWQLPAPAVNPPGGKHLLTTTVTRATDGSPIAGWVVQYELAGGPAAGFGPRLDPAVEVPTDALGQANVEIAQQAAANGVNQVNVSIIRPADPATGIQSRITLATGVTTTTWGTGAVAPPAVPTQPGQTPASQPPATSTGLTLRATGPAQATIGGTTEYQFQVANVSSVAINGVSVTAAVPQHLAFQGSNPQGSLSGSTVTWNVGTLGVGESRTIAVSVQPRQAGAVQFCADALVGGQVAARGCAATTIAADQPLAIDIRTDTGASQFRVGERVKFLITLVNRSNVALTGIELRDAFDDGLRHVAVGDKQAVEFSVPGGLAANESRQVEILEFDITRAGRLCHTMTATSAQGYTATRQVCIDVAGDAAAATEGAVDVRISGPPTINVGRRGIYLVEVSNDGPAALADLEAFVDFTAESLEVSNLMNFENVNNMAAWRIARIEPGQTLRAQIEFSARAANPTSSVAITVQQRRVRVGEAQVPVAVIAGAAPAGQQSQLKLTIAEGGDPIVAGDELTYVVNVENIGGGVASDVVVEMLLPEGVTFPRVQALQKSTTAGRTIRFEPIGALRPLGIASFIVRARSTAAGKYVFQASVTSAASAQPQTATADTKVIPR